MPREVSSLPTRTKGSAALNARVACWASSVAGCSIAVSVSARAPARFSSHARPPSIAPVAPATTTTSATSAAENGSRRPLFLTSGGRRRLLAVALLHLFHHVVEIEARRLLTLRVFLEG